MVFTSPVFLGLFLPAMFAFYFLANNVARPYVLLVFSLLFYAWGEPSAVVTMVALMVVNYVLARAIAASGERRWLAKTLLAVGVTVDLGALVAYKYLGFLAENLLPVLKTVGLGYDVPKIALPIGISTTCSRSSRTSWTSFAAPSRRSATRSSSCCTSASSRS